MCVVLGLKLLDNGERALEHGASLGNGPLLDVRQRADRAVRQAGEPGPSQADPFAGRT
jgi:hypothetical protein